jgi:hypothetical protein
MTYLKDILNLKKDNLRRDIVITKENIKNYVKDDLNNLSEKFPNKAILSSEEAAEKVFNYLKPRYKLDRMDSLNFLKSSALAKFAYQKDPGYTIETGDRLEFQSAFYKPVGLWEVLNVWELDEKVVATLGKVGKRGKVLAERTGTRYRYPAGNIQTEVQNYNTLFPNNQYVKLVKKNNKSDNNEQ